MIWCNFAISVRLSDDEDCYNACLRLPSKAFPKRNAAEALIEATGRNTATFVTGVPTIAQVTNRLSGRDCRDILGNRENNATGIFGGNDTFLGVR